MCSTPSPPKAPESEEPREPRYLLSRRQYERQRGRAGNRPVGTISNPGNARGGTGGGGGGFGGSGLASPLMLARVRERQRQAAGLQP